MSVYQLQRYGSSCGILAFCREFDQQLLSRHIVAQAEFDLLDDSALAASTALGSGTETGVAKPVPQPVGPASVLGADAAEMGRAMDSRSNELSESQTYSAYSSIAWAPQEIGMWGSFCAIA